MTEVLGLYVGIGSISFVGIRYRGKGKEVKGIGDKGMGS